MCPPVPQRKAVRPPVLVNGVLTSEVKRRLASWAALFCVFIDNVSLMCCAANYPLMVSPAYPGAFPDTAPFEETSAQYVIGAATQFGIVLLNIAFGHLSGGVLGARKSFIVLLGASAVLTAGKYFAWGSFWAFTGMSFVNGTQFVRPFVL